MVIWTDNALSHITEFIDETKENTEETAKSYMRKLVDYVDILETMPELGKKMEANTPLHLFLHSTLHTLIGLSVITLPGYNNPSLL